MFAVIVFTIRTGAAHIDHFIFMHFNIDFIFIAAADDGMIAVFCFYNFFHTAAHPVVFTAAEYNRTECIFPCIFHNLSPAALTVTFSSAHCCALPCTS